MKEDRTHNLFDRWDEVSSYMFGFWLADGSIYYKRTKTRSYKMFSLANTDAQIMSQFGQILKHKPYPKKGRKENWNTVYEIQIYSDKLFDFCYKLVGTSSKSKTEISIPNLPKRVFHHFIRGFFDGDGSIHWVTYKTRHSKIIKNLRTSFTAGLSTGQFLKKLTLAIKTHIPLERSAIITNGKTNKKIIFGQYDSMLLCEWMYNDATMFLKRKKKIWDESDKDRLRNSKKYFSNKV